MRARFLFDDRSVEFDAAASTLRIQVMPTASCYDEGALIWLGWGLIAGWTGLERLEVALVSPPCNTTDSTLKSLNAPLQ